MGPSFLPLVLPRALGVFAGGKYLADIASFGGFALGWLWRVVCASLLTAGASPDLSSPSSTFSLLAGYKRWVIFHSSWSDDRSRWVLDAGGLCGVHVPSERRQGLRSEWLLLLMFWEGHSFGGG